MQTTNQDDFLHIHESWLQLVEAVVSQPGDVFLLGAPDTGKSTLALFLSEKLSERGLKVSFLDGDLGQSLVGPPQLWVLHRLLNSLTTGMSFPGITCILSEIPPLHDISWQPLLG